MRRRWPRIFVFFGLISAILMSAVFWGRGDGTVVIQAQTGSAKIAFSGADSWRLEDVIFCQAREKILRRPPAESSDTACEARKFEDRGRFDVLSIGWPANSQVEVQITAGGDVEVRYISGPDIVVDGISYTVGSILILSENGWKRTGALTFAGNASLGQEIGPGTSGILFSGNYEFREGFLRLEAFKTLSGEFFRGDYVNIVDSESKNAPLVGFLNHSNSKGAIEAVLFSTPGDQRIKIIRHRSVPVEVFPTAIDAASSNPLKIAIVACMLFLATILSIVANILETADFVKKNFRKK